MGYEAVRHELGHIAYGREDKPESYAYREIEYCDIIVSVIGGRFGTTSSGSDYSITQQELRKAHELGKQIYIFIERGVHAEFDLYKNNRDIPGVRYTAVNDVKIHNFIEEIYGLPGGNPIFSFNTGSEITTILREQLAGLFQRLLMQEPIKTQTTVTQELQRNLQTVDQLVKFLTEQKTNGDYAVQEILFNNHPIFQALKDAVNNRYRVYFTTLDELGDWIRAARGLKRTEEFLEDRTDFYEWTKIEKTKAGEEITVLYVKKGLFDEDGRLKAMLPAQWNKDWVDLVMKTPSTDADDNIPF
jgi:hypothetical protein